MGRGRRGGGVLLYIGPPCVYGLHLCSQPAGSPAQVSLETDAFCFYFWCSEKKKNPSLYDTEMLWTASTNKQLSEQHRYPDVKRHPSFLSSFCSAREYSISSPPWDIEMGFPLNSPDTSLELQRPTVDNEILVEPGRSLRLFCLFQQHVNMWPS